MILKNIFGKTVEAAKKTAHQMYGDDILILEASEPTSEGQKAKVTIFSDSPLEEKSVTQTRKRTFRDTLKAEDEGVQIERSSTALSASNKREHAN